MFITLLQSLAALSRLCFWQRHLNVSATDAVISLLGMSFRNRSRVSLIEFSCDVSRKRALVQWAVNKFKSSLSLLNDGCIQKVAVKMWKNFYIVIELCWKKDSYVIVYCFFFKSAETTNCM
jgi:hypothetical protein